MSRIPSFLLSTALHFFLLRTTLVALILCLILDISFPYYYRVGIVVDSLAILHCVLCAFNPLIPFFVVGFDFILTIAEVVYFIYTLASGAKRLWHYMQWKGPKFILGFLGSWGATLSISTVLLIKVLHLVDSRGRTLLQRVHIGGERLYSPPDVSGLTGWWEHPISVFTGRKVWERRILGEAHWYIILRGILACCAISSLIIYGVFQIILEPLGDMKLTPTIEFRTSVLPGSLDPLQYPAAWSVVLAHPLFTADDLARIVHAELLLAPTTTVRCEPRNLTSEDFMDASGVFQLQGASDDLVIQCPPFDEETRYRLWGDAPPRLLLTANFTGFGNESSQPRRDVIQVFLGLTHDLKNVLSATRPSSLVRGTNTLAMAELPFDSVCKTPSLPRMGS